MPGISLDLTGDLEEFGRTIGIHDRPHLHTQEDWQIAAVPGGMASGATSLMVAIPVPIPDTDDVATVTAETSLSAWMMATAALRARFADEVEQPGWAHLSPDARALILPRWAEAIRRVQPDTDPARADELAEMFLDALGAGGPEIDHG